MSDLLYIGKIVSTHGIKGELKVISDTNLKEKVFKVGNYLYIDNQKEKIASFRIHKNFSLISLEGYLDINKVGIFLNKDVYIDLEELNLENNEYLTSELIGYEVIDNKSYGKVKEILKGKSCDYLKLESGILVPLISEYVDIINKEEKVIYGKNINNLII